MYIRIILKYFEKYQPSGIVLVLQGSRYVSNEQSCLKTAGSYDDLLFLSSLFHFFYFIFSAPISFSLCSAISPSLFFLMFFLKPLSSILAKLLYTYLCRVHHEKRWAGGTTSWNKNCREKYQ